MTSIVHDSMDALSLTYSDVLTLLSIIAVGMLIILLYHLIFVSVSLRRFAERIDGVSKDIEGLIVKPIGAIDYVIDWFISMIESTKHGKKKK